MLRFLWGDDGGLDTVEERFVGMLHDARHVFDLAIGARFGGADPATVAQDLTDTEERTDEAEREIRRRVLVHASAHGAQADFSTCLRYMSVAKDGERIADLAKQLFGIAEVIGAVDPGPVRDDLSDLGARISPLIADVAEAFRSDDEARAEAAIEAAREVQTRCRARINELLREEVDVPYPAATALSYRQLSRVAANVLNIASSVVMPLHQIDYPRQDDRR